MDSLLGATPLKGILDADKEYHEGAKSGLGASDTGKQILQNHEKLESEKAEAALDGRHAAYKAKRESEMAKLLADELSSAFKKSTEELRQTLENIDKAMKDLSDGKGIYAGVKKDSDFYQQEMSRLNKESQEISGKIQMQVDFDPSQIAEALKGAGGNLDPKVLQDAIAKQFQKYGETGQKEMLKRIAEIIQKTMQDLGK